MSICVILKEEWHRGRGFTEEGVYESMLCNVMSSIGPWIMNVVFTMIGFAIKKNPAVQFVAYLLSIQV